jgi:cytochrome c oxidase subunit 2
MGFLLAAMLGCGGPAGGPEGAGSVTDPERCADTVAAGAPFIVQVTGRDFRWHVRYPGADGRLGTADDLRGERDVHLPACASARIELESDDYIYTLSLPHRGLREIAVPAMTFALEFDTGPAGTYDLRGDQLCGYAHPALIGKLVIEPGAAFESRLGAAPGR